MLIIDFSQSFSALIWRKVSRKSRGVFQLILAQKKDIPEIAKSSEEKPAVRFSCSGIILQSAIGLFSLGFIDAGYSGDWSRIGVISTETEDSLKVAAFLVVPFCLFLIFALSKKERD